MQARRRSSPCEAIYKLFEVEKPRLIEKQSDITDAPTLDASATWNDVANSSFHRIVAHPKIFP